jgi:hypothetical protein
VSFQVTVLKVLAGHPGGCLSIDDLKRAVAILITSGPDWTERTKRLLARVPDLDIFSQSLVTRYDHGWQITEAGRTLLAAIENPTAALAVDAQTNVAAVGPPTYSTSAPLPTHIVGRRRRSRTRIGRRQQFTAAK